MEIKTCEHCAKVFEKPYHVSRPAFAKRRYCSRACMVEARRPKARTCGHCGKEFTPIPQSAGRYCSQACAYATRKGRTGEAAPSWKGGRIEHEGYIRVRVNGRYEMEHRLVMERLLARPLRSDETVHHKNGVRNDNRPENLELRVSRHGKGAEMCCADCGSRNIVAWTES